jgi:hypothetical protein
MASGLSANAVSWFYINGQLQTYGSDYTVASTTLTIAADRPAPTASDVLKLYGSVGYVAVGGGSSGTSGTAGSSGTSGIVNGGLNIVIDGGGLPITSGIKMDIEWKFAATITSWDIFADQTGSIVVDIWSSTYAGFPPTVANTITGTEKPTITAGNSKNQDTSLTSFNTAVASGSIWRINVDSAATVTRVTIAFAYSRS